MQPTLRPRETDDGSQQHLRPQQQILKLHRALDGGYTRCFGGFGVEFHFWGTVDGEGWLREVVGLEVVGDGFGVGEDAGGELEDVGCHGGCGGGEVGVRGMRGEEGMRG